MIQVNIVDFMSLLKAMCHVKANTIDLANAMRFKCSVALLQVFDHTMMTPKTKASASNFICTEARENLTQFQVFVLILPTEFAYLSPTIFI